MDTTRVCNVWRDAPLRSHGDSSHAALADPTPPTGATAGAGPHLPHSHRLSFPRLPAPWLLFSRNAGTISRQHCQVKTTLYLNTRLILHAALVSTNEDNDSVSMAPDGKLSRQVWSFPIIDFFELHFEKGEVSSLSRFFSTSNKGQERPPN